MKYPFSPDVLDALPEQIAELYRQFELDLLTGICEQLKGNDELNETSIQKIRALRSQGVSQKEINKAIAKLSKRSEQSVQALLTDVYDRNRKYYGAVARDVSKPEIIMSQADVDAIMAQTKGEVANITRSMAFVLDGLDGVNRSVLLSNALVWACDKSLVEINSGAKSYSEAIKTAVKGLADSGIRTVDFENGRTDSVDVAVRRSVMTGINQLNHRYSEQAMQELETDLVEVSAHAGARDTGIGIENHKSWQGKVYEWTKDGQKPVGKYPDFEKSTGYGDGAGLGGWNCRHTFYPFIDGVSERTYTDEELANIDQPPFTFDGKQYTQYEATQKQREIERTIRKLTREKTGYEAAGLAKDAQNAAAKIAVLKNKYKKFSKASHLPMQNERMKVFY